MIEKLINLRIAMKKNLPKRIVNQKFSEYKRDYDEKEKDIIEKVEYRIVFVDYIRYMSRGGDKK